MILNVNAVASVALIVSIASRQYRLHTFDTIVSVVCKLTVEGTDSKKQNIRNYGFFVGTKDLSLVPHPSHWFDVSCFPRSAIRAQCRVVLPPHWRSYKWCTLVLRTSYHISSWVCALLTSTPARCPSFMPLDPQRDPSLRMGNLSNATHVGC